MKNRNAEDSKAELNHLDSLEGKTMANLTERQMENKVEGAKFQKSELDSLGCVYQGDCLDVLKAMPDQSVNCAITSPPYNMGIRICYGKYRKRSDKSAAKYSHFPDNMPIYEFKAFHRQVIRELLRVSPILFYNIQIVTGSKEAFLELIGEFGRNIKDIAIWDKGHGEPAMQSKVMNRASELVLIMESDGKPGRAFKKAYFKRGTMEDIWRINRAKPAESNTPDVAKGTDPDKVEHRASFPEEFVEKILNGWTKEGDIVLDPFAGTGTTLAVAKRMNRRYAGIELCPQYVDLIKKRIKSQDGFEAAKLIGQLENYKSQ